MRPRRTPGRKRSRARSCVEPPARGTGLTGDVVFEVPAELAHQAERRHGRALTERTDGVAHDPAADLVDSVELFERSLAGVDLGDDAIDPARALTARRALAARLVAIEGHQVLHHRHWTG